MSGSLGRQEKSMAVQGPIPVEFGQVFPRGVRGGGGRAGAGFRGVEGRAVRAVEGQGERPAAVGDRRDRRRHLGAGQDGSGEGRGGGSAGAAARAPGDAVRPGGVRRADGHPASATKPLRQVWGRSCGTPGRSATPPAERAHNGHADATGHPEYHSENNDHASDLGGNHGAGEGNRTLMTSLEGWSKAAINSVNFVFGVESRQIKIGLNPLSLQSTGKSSSSFQRPWPEAAIVTRILKIGRTSFRER